MRAYRAGVLAVLGVGLGAAPGLAQTPGGPDVLAPTFAPTTAVAPGVIDLEDSEPSYTLDRTIHGSLSTGIGTGGARGVAGAVLVPVVPGVVSLEAGGGTGQQGVRSFGPGGKTGTARLSTYYAALHVRPSADVQIDVAVSGADVRLPGGGGFGGK